MLWLITWGLWAAAYASLALTLGLAALRWTLRSRRPAAGAPRKIAFFHPYSTGGGGGERVLWSMLTGLQAKYPNDDITLYTHWVGGKGGAGLEHHELKEMIAKKFGVDLQRAVNIVLLRGVTWVEAKTWPRFTLICQSLGAIPLALEALLADTPDVFIDSMGYAFTYPIARYLAGCKVICYTHYPTVSTDMLHAVISRKAAHNNSARIAGSAVLSFAKGVYYRLFAVLYGAVGRCADVVMVNSSWTQGHITHIWGLPREAVHCVFPPCDCTHLRKLRAEKELRIIGVAQFRPEKNHPLQLNAFATLLQQLPPDVAKDVRLELVGGVRDDADRQRVKDLQELAVRLGIQDAVSFHVDLPYEELKRLLSVSVAGIHTMWNEHFGIGIVEYMASGCIPIAHRSGGPLLDIVREGDSGMLAETEEEYAKCMQDVVLMRPQLRAEMADRARERSLRFTEEVFVDGVLKCTAGIFA